MDLMGNDGVPRRVRAVAAVLTSIVMGTTFAADGSAAVDAGLDVTDYDITLDYQPDTRELRGVAVLSAKATTPLAGFTLRIEELTVRSVTVDSRVAKSFSQLENGELVIEPSAPIGRGADFRVRIEYDGTPGAAWLPTTSGGATAFLGNPSAWFPAHENAADPASFRLAATVPDGWSVVSIGREGKTESTGAATTFRWAEQQVDPGNVAVTIDRMTVERSALADGTPVVNAYAAGLEKTTKPLADRMPEIIGFLSGKFGRYPFQSAGNVFVHVDDDAPATAPQTRPVYLGAANERYMTLNTVVHEQAHQWYGVYTTIKQPADLCVSECFAVYATWLWDEAKSGADLDDRYRAEVDARTGDAEFWKELYRPGAAPGSNVYTKGPLALHALRHKVGNEAFERLLREWPHRGGYVDWPQFEAFTRTVTGQDLSGFFRSWFHAATVPADEHLWPGALKP